MKHAARRLHLAIFIVQMSKLKGLQNCLTSTINTLKDNIYVLKMEKNVIAIAHLRIKSSLRHIGRRAGLDEQPKNPLLNSTTKSVLL